MSKVTIKKVISKQDLKKFVTFPFELYKDSKYWVPPLISDEIATFSKDKNPVFDNADAEFFLAYRNNKIVGRVAAIINFFEVEKQQVKRMRFGWFDVIDDVEVTKALLDKVKEIGKAKGLDFVEGPMGFSNLDKVGALTEGFDHIGSMSTWYNYPYYSEHLEQLGFTPEKEYVETKVLLEDIGNYRFLRAYDVVVKRYGYKAMKFTKTKDIMPYVDDMFDLFDRSYEQLPTYVPINKRQREYFKKKFINFINPEYILFVMNPENEMVGFAIILPCFAKALQEAKGKLFPFGIFKLLKARKQTDPLMFYLIGVDPRYQNKAAHVVIFYEFFKQFESKNIKNCIRLPELANNQAEQQIWKDFETEVIKRRKTFKMAL